MARKYKTRIVLLGSWIADLNQSEMTDSQKWEVVLAIAKAQQSGNTGFIRELPQEIRRYISVCTIIEQCENILARKEWYRNNGRKGGIAKRDAYDINANVRKYEEPRGTMSILDWEKIKSDLNK